MLYELVCWKSILQPGRQGGKVFKIPLSSSFESRKLLQIIVSFFINLCVTEDSYLSASRCFDFIAADRIFSSSVLSIGLVQESCVLFNIGLLSLKFRELHK